MNYGKALRSTKIIATLGPATDKKEVMESLILAGVDAVRLNFSHGDKEEHIARAKIVRELSTKVNYHIGIIGDLQGPKIRVGRFVDGGVLLKKNQKFILDPNWDVDAGTAERVGLTYPELYNDVKAGDTLLLDDGRVELEVESSSATGIITRSITEKFLGNNKGVNRKGGGLSAPSITDKDREDIKLAAALGIDYLAVSFPKNAQDILFAKQLLRDEHSNAGIIAKIERADALKAIDEIIEVSDAIMIARGDLNLEIGDPELIAVQKRLIRKTREKDKVVITATEMMQSMIDSPQPTRAEISDVANAVLDGTDAVMLSGETAVGKYPVEAVVRMSNICLGAEQYEDESMRATKPKKTFIRIDRAIALAAMQAGQALKVAAIATLTESGSTALWMSRVRSSIPIYALTHHLETCRKVTIYRGVYPGKLDKHDNKIELGHETIDALSKRKAVKAGDLIILTKGDMKGVQGGTNTMKIIRV